MIVKPRARRFWVRPTLRESTAGFSFGHGALIQSFPDCLCVSGDQAVVLSSLRAHVQNVGRRRRFMDLLGHYSRLFAAVLNTSFLLLVPCGWAHSRVLRVLNLPKASPGTDVHKSLVSFSASSSRSSEGPALCVPRTEWPRGRLGSMFSRWTALEYERVFFARRARMVFSSYKELCVTRSPLCAVARCLSGSCFRQSRVRFSRGRL